MAQSRDSLQPLVMELADLGLSVFGGFQIDAADCPDNFKAFAGKRGILIGNVGGSMWSRFSVSPEYADGLPGPMDRWTERVVSALAQNYEAFPIFPSSKPYWPFQRFALRTGHGHSSPLGILIHHKYGLWHGYRAVLVFDKNHAFASDISAVEEQSENMIHPCETCRTKPCLTACPVDAFDGSTLHRDKCDRHLQSLHRPDCMNLGCRARDACPVGTEFRYGAEQIRFHMKAFADQGL